MKEREKMGGWRERTDGCEHGRPMQKGRGRTVLRRYGLTAAVLVLALFSCLATGCKKGVAMMAEGGTERGYTLPQIMVIAVTEKKRYEEVCTDQIWNVQVRDGEETFGSLLTEQIKSFMEEMKFMNLLARERKISLTSDEKSDMALAAGEYYGSLTDEDIKFMGVTEEDVRTVFEEYRLADKLVDELTGDVSLEVSDSEAKVITILQAAAGDRETAERLAAAASEEGADFQKCATDAGLTASQRQLGRAEESQMFEDAAFALTAGEVSRVIEDGGTFYVVKCLNDYDEEATEKRKEQIYRERKWKAFTEIYDGFKAGITLTYTGDPWEKLDFSRAGIAGDADFFGLYKKYTRQ